MRFEVYTKPGCSLCDEALEVLTDAVAERGLQRSVEVTAINILQDPALWERYRYDIPVVRLDGVERFRHRVDAEAIRVLLDGDVTAI